MVRRVVAVVAAVAGVDAHASLEYPRPRAMTRAVNHSSACDVTGQQPPPDGDCLWAAKHPKYMYSHGCYIGCKSCIGTAADPTKCSALPPGADCCEKVIPPTVTDPSLRTYQDIQWPDMGMRIDWTSQSPWRAPGYAPVVDPCGVMGGFPHRNARDYVQGNGGWPPVGYGGQRGSELPESPDKQTWKSGSTVEVSWSLLANHGGGYQYRLCPKSRNLTEECFQDMPLQFAGRRSWIQFGKKRGGGRVAFEASRVSDGTWPKGSTWTKNPIAPCSSPQGGTALEPCPGAQFEPPVKGTFGFGAATCMVAATATDLGIGHCNQTGWDTVNKYYDYSIVDAVRIPAGLKGEYVLGWRWDAEQTPQVWQNCADVSIE